MATTRPEEHIVDHLGFLYGAERAPALFDRLSAILDQFREQNPQFAPAAKEFAHQGRSTQLLTEKDVILITYGDQVTEPGVPPLQILAQVLEKYTSGTITGVHVLPFYPYSSDDGFSVIDYTAVDPDLGLWSDIACLGRSFRLMFDAVINHISAQSRWFQEFLAGNPRYADYFIVVEEGTDLSQVVRPRALPLLTRVETATGDRWVWTTFSVDQIDLNYANPDVLLEIVQVLLWYVEKGAEIIRLDAIAYLWKKIGTPCIHLEETHRVVKLFRAILDAVAPHVILLTETNVPHEENISYFGNSADKLDPCDEAQMVYQFPLSPLVLHAICSGDASCLSEWAAQLGTPAAGTTFFNFLATHDGIGLRASEGILNEAERAIIVQRTLDHGGHVSYMSEPDGGQRAYELNISYFDALSDPHGGEPLDLQVRRFLLSQAIALSLAGVPGIYVHSLFGSRSDHAGVERTGRYRSINRQKFQRHRLEQALADPASLRHQVFYAYLRLIRIRAGQRAFHPNGLQQVVSIHPAIFALVRTAPDRSESLLCLHNVSDAALPVQIDLDTLSISHAGRARDLVGERVYPVDTTGKLRLAVAAYQVLWLAGEV